MKKHLNLLLLCSLFVTFLATGITNGQQQKSFRCAWISFSHIDTVLERVKDAKFNAVVFYWNREKTPAAIERAQKLGLDCYIWVTPVFPKGDKKLYLQQMFENETTILQKELELKRQKKLFPSGYQGGGEPLPKRQEVLINKMPCFHKPQVVSATKKYIKDILQNLPQANGIALDMFGYRNYYCCYCEASKVAFRKYCAKHNLKPERESSWRQFSLDSLVDFQNEMCKYARSLKPNIKITNHVWPVYMPEPLYGNRLDIDYCAQTVAWFFKPYWSDKKIVK